MAVPLEKPFENAMLRYSSISCSSKLSVLLFSDMNYDSLSVATTARRPLNTSKIRLSDKLNIHLQPGHLYTGLVWSWNSGDSISRLYCKRSKSFLHLGQVNSLPLRSDLDISYNRAVNYSTYYKQHIWI